MYKLLHGHLASLNRSTGRPKSGSALQIDVLHAKLKQLEEKQHEAELSSSQSLPSVTEGKDTSGSEVMAQGRPSPRHIGQQLEAASRRQVPSVSFSLTDLALSKGTTAAECNTSQLQTVTDKGAVLTEGAHGPAARLKFGRSSLGTLDNTHRAMAEPERLPCVEPEQDGSFQLKGLSRLRILGDKAKPLKLESFDRRLGRQPNAIVQASSHLLWRDHECHHSVSCL